MTRSEELQLAISIARENVKSLKLHHISEPKIAQLTLDLLLAEQKRSDGCDKCNDPKILEIQIETGFNFCPHCGRSLTDGESA